MEEIKELETLEISALDIEFDGDTKVEIEETEPTDVEFDNRPETHDVEEAKEDVRGDE
jgi:hypothetical protein